MISVVIPVYNRSWQLRRALKSLAEQTYQKFEVVVCDDGSSEDVASVVAEYRNCLVIILVRINNSGGPARPRNIAINNSQGNWIAFLDSDDWWDKQRIEVVASSLNDSVDLLYHSLRLVDRRNRSVRRGVKNIVGFPMKGNPLRHMALYGNPIPASAAVVRRSMLESIGGICEDPNLIAFEDFDTWLRLAECGARVTYINAILGSYWIGDDSISLMSEKQIHRQVFLFERHLEYFSPFAKQAIARQNYVLGMMWSRVKGCSRIAFDHLSQAKNLPSLKMKMSRTIRCTLLWLMELNK